MQCGSIFPSFFFFFLFHLLLAIILNNDIDGDVLFLVFNAVLVELSFNGAHLKFSAAVCTRSLAEIIFIVLMERTAFPN